MRSPRLKTVLDFSFALYTSESHTQPALKSLRPNVTAPEGATCNSSDSLHTCRMNGVAAPTASDALFEANGMAYSCVACVICVISTSGALCEALVVMDSASRMFEKHPPPLE